MIQNLKWGFYEHRKNFQKFTFSRFLSLILIIISSAVDGSYSNNNNVEIFPDAILPEPFILTISFGYIIIHPIILFLLYRFNSFGKLAYLPLIIFCLVITALSGTTTLSGLTGLGALGMMLSGAIITMLYFTEIKKKFE